MAQDYRELATTLRGRIDAGEFRQTGKLPTEDQLIEEYQTTRYRVRNAIAVLAEAGDVFPVRGSGVFVREDREGDYLSIGTTRGISAEYPHRKVTSVVQELSLLQADSVLAKRMHCAEGDQVWRVVRLRQVDAIRWHMRRRGISRNSCRSSMSRSPRGRCSGMRATTSV